MSELERMKNQFQTELKMIQTLYQETAKNASKALEDVQKTNEETSKNARSVFEEVKIASKDLKSLVKKSFLIAAAVASIVGSICVFFGVETYQDFKTKVKETAEFRKQAEYYATDSKNNASESIKYATKSKELSGIIEKHMGTARKNLSKLNSLVSQAESIRQIVLEVNRISEGCRVNQEPDPQDSERLLDLYIKHQFLKKDLFSPYINEYTNYAYEVVFEALVAYLEITKNAGIEHDPNEIQKMKKAIIFVLNEVTQKKAPSSWRIARKCRELYIDLCNWKQGALTSRPEEISTELTIEFITSGENSDLKWNIALIMSELGISDPQAIGYLLSGMKKHRSDWPLCLSCIALIKLQKDAGWDWISKQFKNDSKDSAFIASLLLGRLGKKDLNYLGIEKLAVGPQVDRIALIKKILEKYRDEASNKYSEMYLTNVIEKL